MKINLKKIMQLVKATIKDIKMLLEVEKTAQGLRTYSGDFSEKEIEEWLESDTIYLIKNKDIIMGSISYEVKDAENVYISGLVIKPEFQKQGLGGQAMKKILEELKECKKISLVVHPDNPAVKLYQSLGFKNTGCKENYYGDGEPRLMMLRANKK